MSKRPTGRELEGLRLSVAGALFLLHLAGRGRGHGLYGRATRRQPNGTTPSCCCTARISAPPPGRAPSRSLTEAGYRVIAPDQIGFCKSTQARALPVQLPAACRKHARAARFARHHPRDGHRAFDGRHARHALRADVSRRRRTAGAGRSDRARGLEGEGRALAKHRRAGISRSCKTTADSIRDYERATYYAGHLGRRIRALGADAGRACIAAPDATSSPGIRRCLYDMIYTQPVFYEFEKIAAPVLLLDRRQGHDCDRQAPRAAGGARDARPLSGYWQRKRRRASRMRS